MIDNLISESPILFSPAMIERILANEKLESRRVVKQQQVNMALCPFGKPGDHLWVRERWRTIKAYDGNSPSGIARMLERRVPRHQIPIEYSTGERVNWNSDWGNADVPGRWRASIHMPRNFSRITLVIDEIRIERLNDITHDGAIAEGIKWSEGQRSAPVLDFAIYWDSLHPIKDRWVDNPLVWILRFHRLKT